MDKDYDYEKLGMKSGLEIHQQLDTHKLFCNCPSFLRSDVPDFEIHRRLHAIAGESGEIDAAVLHEAKLGKGFIYQGYKDTTCLVELDESPPEIINKEALKIVLQVALLLNCEIIPVAQIMRKTVIDGSNTSGFQRTILIAKNGFVETKYGRVGIESVALEEDAARIIEKTEKKDVYRLDRLGIPLVEIATAPDMKNPEQVKQVALHIGDVLRACKVKRGIGTIRQDINISIKGHPRVEIKGFQEPKMFVDTINKEIERQLENIEKNNLRGEVRRANPDGTTDFMRPIPGSARMYPETDLPLLKISLIEINDIKKNLPKLRVEIKGELEKSGLSNELIKLILKQNKLEEFKDLLKVNEDANLIAKMLVLWPKDFSAKIGKDISRKLSLDVLESVLQELKKGVIEKHNIQDILFEIAKGKPVEQALKIGKLDVNEIEQFIIKLVKEKPGLSISAYMGLVMEKFKGKVSGKIIMEVLKKYVR